MTDQHYTNAKEQVFPYHVFSELGPEYVTRHLAKITHGKPQKVIKSRRARRIANGKVRA